jgi:hypothetical protein
VVVVLWVLLIEPVRLWDLLLVFSGGGGPNAGPGVS